jgi:hypothetical protein
VLDGLHLGRGGVAAGADGGGHAGVADRLRVDADVRRLGQVDAAEGDAGVRRGRTQRQRDLLAAVHAHADGLDDGFEGALAEHDCGLSSMARGPTAGRASAPSEDPISLETPVRLPI